jgi:hypothetical protein
LPGTAGKLDVLAERARLGLPLFSPGDGDFGEGVAAVPVIARGNFTTVGRRVVVSERDHRRLVQAREADEAARKKEPPLPPPLLSRPAPPAPPAAEGLEQLVALAELLKECRGTPLRRVQDQRQDTA